MNPSSDSDRGGFRRSTGSNVGRDPEAVIAGIERRLDEMAAAQRATRWLLLGGSLALLGLLSWFGMSLYRTLEERLRAEKMQAAVLAKVEQVLPPLSQRLVDSASAVAPVYGELAMKRFEQVRPRFETLVIDESGRFAERVRGAILAESNAGMKRVTDRVAADLKRQLPNISEAKLDDIEKRLREALLVAGGDVVEQVERKFTTERTRIEQLLARLPVEERASEPEDKLQRSFIHQLLMLIDQAVMSENSPIR